MSGPDPADVPASQRPGTSAETPTDAVTDLFAALLAFLPLRTFDRIAALERLCALLGMELARLHADAARGDRDARERAR